MGRDEVGTPPRPAAAGQPGINIARFDLVSLRLAVLCADRGSLKEAAKLANLSVSAASQRLTALEGLIGAPLFLREPRGLRPTEFGKAFVEHARTILNHLEILMLHVLKAAQHAGPSSQPADRQGHRTANGYVPSPPALTASLRHFLL